MGSQKVPKVVVLHSNGRTFGTTYLITFKAGPVRERTLAPSTLPFLEAPAKASFWNLPTFGRRIRFDYLHAYEMYPLEVHFRPPLWSSSQEFLAANLEVPGSIPGATKFSE
jgi:hypothetical protein